MNLTQSFYTDRNTDSPSLINLDLCPSTKYKFEQGGLLVYDVKLQIKTPKLYPSFLPSNFEPFRIESDFVLEVPEDEVTLEFDSHFECGNLFKAVKLSDYEYNLYLKSDTKSPRHNHWYYFSVYNPRKTSVTFNICNMRKPDPLYSMGMKPCTWSCKSKELDNIEWNRSGSSISYIRNSNGYFTLKFTYNFKHANDTVFFAYSIPYTYTQLHESLNHLKSHYKDILRVNKLCHTNNNKECELVTITDSIEDYLDFNSELKEIKESSRHITKFRKPRSGQLKKLPEKHMNKKAIILMARVHPGETVSSFMMQGAIEFLTSSQKSAVFLRRNFVFKLIPMLNPDGVCAGNYRCCLNGSDLNRKWKRPHKSTYPTIFYAKSMVFATAARHEVKMICDFHGHTKKKNVFMYGCSVKPETYEDIRNNLLTRIAPYYMFSHNKDFSFKLSHFRLEKYKESTSRIVFFKELQLPHSYTMEASFFGPENSNCHFSIKDLNNLGKDICRFCTVFAKDSLYCRIVADTNNYLREAKLKVILNKQSARVQNEEGLLEIEKAQELTEKLQDISETEEKNEEEEEELLETVEDTSISTFWQSLEPVKCFPDPDSSGSDDDFVIKEDIEEEKACNAIDDVLNSPIQPLYSSLEIDKKVKVSERANYYKKRQSNQLKSSGIPSSCKKANESLYLQTFKFPDTDFDRKTGNIFEPSKPHSNLKSFKRKNSNSLMGGKASLSFLPALSSINKCGDKKISLQSFAGFEEHLKRIISQASHNQSRR